MVLVERVVVADVRVAVLVPLVERVVVAVVRVALPVGRTLSLVERVVVTRVGAFVLPLMLRPPPASWRTPASRLTVLFGVRAASPLRTVLALEPRNSRALV